MSQCLLLTLSSEEKGRSVDWISCQLRARGSFCKILHKFPTNQPYLFHFLCKSTMTELVSSGCLKSNTPRADRRQAAVVSCWDKRKRESREKEGGSAWMKKEGVKVRMSNDEIHTAQDPLTHTPYNTNRLHAHPPTNAPTHTTTHMYTHKSCNTINGGRLIKFQSTN